MKNYRIIKKQFIAGAVCPECAQVDRIVVEFAVSGENSEAEQDGIELQAGKERADTDKADTDKEGAVSRRRCVHCDFADPFAALVEAQPVGVPRGRPEKPRVVINTEDAVRVVNIIAPKRE